MHKLMIILLFITCFLDAKTLNIALQSTKNTYNTSMQDIKMSFEKIYPDTQINFHFYDGSSYKKQFNSLLNNPNIDILTWQAGQRLFDYKNKLHPLNTLWDTYDFDEKFYPSLKSNISQNNIIYAIAISYYGWGIYYNKKVFKKYNLTIPKTLQEFLDVSKVLKQNNIIPIALGGKNHWTTVAWFDYINLRLNGLEFRKKLLQGEISYTNKKIKDVFQYLKVLSNKDYFIKHFDKYTWLEPMPYLYRQKAAMTLIGNFFVTQIPQIIQNDIGYFQFPTKKSNEKIYFENAPLEVFVISKNSSNKKLATKFLRFFSQKNIINTFNAKQNMISPIIDSTNVNTKHLNNVKNILDKASGLAQFYDIDSKQEFANEVLPIFSAFLKNPNIEETTLKLEQIRKKHYGTLQK